MIPGSGVSEWSQGPQPLLPRDLDGHLLTQFSGATISPKTWKHWLPPVLGPLCPPSEIQLPLTSLHFASKVDAVGFLANTAGCLGPRARLLEGYDAGGTLEAILSTVVLGSWEEGGVQGTKRCLGSPSPRQSHNNPKEQRL